MLIKGVELLCSDLYKAEQFYCKNFGLQLLSRTGDLLKIKIGDSILTFKKTEDLKPYYHFAFNIPNNQIREAVEWLKVKAQLIYSEGSAIVDFKNWDAESVYFLDANENVVEFIGRREINNKSDLPFTSASLLSISEIGIVVENISEACSSFLKEHQLAPFIKQPVLQNFAALGDDNGLLILSTEGRNWYPTDFQVKKFPVTVEFENRGVNYKLIL
jgi:catechol-2,3-dioxygenase